MSHFNLYFKSKSQKQQEQEHKVVIDDGMWSIESGQIIIDEYFLF